MSRLKEVFKEIMDSDGLNQEKLAEELDKTPANISIGLKKGNLVIKVLKRWLKPLNAKLIIKHKNKNYEL